MENTNERLIFIRKQTKFSHVRIIEHMFVGHFTYVREAVNICSWGYEHMFVNLCSLLFKIDMLKALIVLGVVVADGIFWFIKFGSNVGSGKDKLVCIIGPFLLLYIFHTNSVTIKTRS